MESEQDHYAILQVHPEAYQEVITAAYRRLAYLYHPDRNPSQEAARRMVQINVAYDVLRDPGKRANYDRRRAEAERRDAEYFGGYPSYEVEERIIIVEESKGCGYWLGQIISFVVWFVIGLFVLGVLVSVCTSAAAG